MKHKLLIISIIVLIALAFGWNIYQKQSAKIIHLTPEKLASLKAEVAKQNEQGFVKPEFQQREIIQKSEEKNIYFGDLHIHTALSFDSYLFGNRLGIKDAYRFANGKELTSVAGEKMRLSRPLDFAAVTDHAESFGLFIGCGQAELSTTQQEYCQSFEQPSLTLFLKLKQIGIDRPLVRPMDHCDGDAIKCREYEDTTWRQTQAAADEFYRPGEFTTFSAYEYSPSLPSQGKMHRNIIFKNNVVPNHAVSAFDEDSVLGLWRSLEKNCQGKCDFLTIPHNLNKSWGIAYSGKTIDGDVYSKSDWALRGRSEPLAEIFQIKGDSECGVGAGAVDEECSFEKIVPICENGIDKEGCSGKNSFVREGLKKGLALEQELGFNPLQVGFIGSTDTHNTTPGDTEEWDYRGASNVYESPARQRTGYLGNGKYKDISDVKAILKNPGGLAAVWAKENTREAIFEALKNRETYATSGTRIKLRFFSAWDLPEDIINQPNLITTAYQQGVPMGSVMNIRKDGQSPAFIVWAMKDPLSANLQKIQMIKAWMEDGERKEKVFDIACSDGLSVDMATGRCPDNNSKVNINTCATDDSKGAKELKVLWRDEEFKAQQSAFYYVRVLQNPTCRWSTYDAIRLGTKPRADVPVTVRERVWSSPIWYSY